MPTFVRPLISVTAAVLLAGVTTVLTGPAAEAYTVTAHAKAQVLREDQGKVALAGVTVTGKAGDVHIIRTQLYATANTQYLKDSPPNTNRAVSLGSVIECYASGNGTLVTQLSSGRNLLPTDHNARVTNRLAFTIPARYTTTTSFLCELVSSVASHNSTPGRANILSTSFIGDIWGRLGGSARGQVVARTPELLHPVFVAPGAPWARYLTLSRYSLPGGYPSFDAFADLYITECHGDSPRPKNFCTGFPGPYHQTTAQSQLVVTQLGRDGNVCAQWLGPKHTTVVDSILHHRKVMSSVIGVHPKPGCANIFSVALWLSASAHQNGYVISWGGGTYSTIYVIARRASATT